MASRSHIWMISVAALFAAFATADAQTPPAGHLLTVDDMLAMDHFGRVEIADGGRLVLFEKGGPGEGFTDYGIDDPSASGRIYVFDRSKQAPARRLLADFPFQNWIGALSPNGEKLAIYWLEKDRVRAGVVDLATGKLTRFAFYPTFDFQQSIPLWVSDNSLIYSADPNDRPSARVDFRRQAALQVSANWQRAWHGEPSISVLESHAKDFTPDWRPGTIVRVDAKTGDTRMLAEGKYIEMSLSADHRYLAAGRQGYYNRFRPDSGREVYDNHRLEPRLFDLDNPKAGAVPMCSGCQLSGLAEFTWSATGHRASFFARFGNEAWERARFRVFDADTKSLSEVRHIGLDLASQREIGMQNAPVMAIPFGDGALVPARQQADPKADPIFTYKEPTHSRQYNITSSAAAKMARLDWYFVSPDGSSHAVTSALPDVDSVTVASDNRGLYFIGGDKVQRVSLNGGDIVDAAKFDGQAFYYKLDGSIDSGGHAVGVSISPTGMAAEFFQGTTKLKSVKLPPTIGRPVAGDAKSGALVFQSAGAGGSVLSAVDQSGRVQTIIAINEHLKQVIPAKEVQLKYKLPNGDQTSACLLLPANAPPGKKLPTIVWVYPGGAGARCQSLWQLGLADTYSAEILTSFGYAVLTPPAPAPLLTDGHNPVANWGALVQPAVDEAVAEGYTDKDKLGAWGMSLGGHSVLSLLSQTNMFKAAIALNGAADFFSNYASLGTVRSVLSDDLFAVGHSTLYEGAPEEGAHLGAPPWEIPQAYAIASPLSNAGKMNTPLMLFANDLDWDYQMTEFDQYFIAMVRQGKEAVYVRSWGEGHGDTNPANVRESWRRMHAWYEQHFNAVP